MPISFSKYSGCGNDFILIDNRGLRFQHMQKNLISRLCHRQKGIGADGIILLENSAQADYRMRIFNADGSEAEMCGNGIRCLLKFIRELGLSDQSCSIETVLRTLRVNFRGQDVEVGMGRPFDLRWNHSLNVDGQTISFHYVNTGVPHAILFVEDLQATDVIGLGAKIRHHPALAPQGANVNFALLAPNGEIWNRTYERGVEQETLACGTGCTAVAIAASKIYGLKSPVRIHTRSQDVLEISFSCRDGEPEDVTLTGPAQKIFEGVYNLH